MTTITRTEGVRYAETADLDIAAIAKLVRADLKQAVKDGAIPDVPYRVRIERYSMGQSITVSASLPGPDRVPSSDPRSCMYGRDQDYPNGLHATATVEQVEAGETIQGLLDAYNRTASDAHTDYSRAKFFGHVNLTGSEPAT